MRIGSVQSTDLFGGTAARPLQIVRVELANTGPEAITDPLGQVSVRIDGPGVSTPEPAVVTGLAPGAEVTAEVAVLIAAPAQPGSPRQVQVTVAGPEQQVQHPAVITVAETGWVMWMVSHFHYDPVWWDTQGQFTESRVLLPDDDGKLPDSRTAFELVRLHLNEARQDPDYKFVLAELDYLKPYFDAHPQDRADLLEFINTGRVELVGGSYNEANTNLTCAESTIRNAVYGLAYQRDVLRGNPRTSWMLDAFGFDPGYPGIMAAAGMTDSSWARGPFHQWGPRSTVGDNTLMQFSSEFEWLSPDGTGLLTSYMANHYSAGWVTQRAKTLAEAEEHAYQQFSQLAAVASTRNVLLPVGTDHVIPSRWATQIHRDWNARYTWPRFVTAVPSEFFAAVRADAADRDIWITPQTRDMNPVYTGKDVTYIDTKQGQRAAEVAVLDGERLATLAWLAGARYPTASIDKAWRLLAFGAHHDAITGTESDQVYLDLLAGWREAWERGDQARRAAVAHLSGLADTASLALVGQHAPAGPPPVAVVVVNSLSVDRSGLASIRLDLPDGWPRWLRLLDAAGEAVPFLADGVTRTTTGDLAGVTVTFRARSVPGVGYRSYLAVPEGDVPPGACGWQPEPGARPVAQNDAFLVEADPARGGTLARILDKATGTELLTAQGGGNELLLQPEHPGHPRWGEGPWLLSPAGPGNGSHELPAEVRVERCPIGSRLVARLDFGGLKVTQETLLLDGAGRLEFRTHVDGAIEHDHLLRVLFPANVPGGLPVYQTAVSVIGRPPGQIDVDVAEHAFTLDSPAAEWFAVGSTARVAHRSPDGGAQLQAIGVAEVVAPHGLREQARTVLTALAAKGVTATCSLPRGPRYGYAELDSNLPDFRLCLGGPDANEFTAAVLAAAGPNAAADLSAQLTEHGSARLWLPAARSRADAFRPGTDLRGPLDLPVLILAADDMPSACSALADDLADAVIEVAGPAGDADRDGAGGTGAGGTGAGGTGAGGTGAGGTGAAGGTATALAGHTVALLNRGTPSGLVTPEGVLSMALMRACSTWPCGVWIDGDKRSCPDGTSFAWQHWSHTFEYALAAGPGDWRTAGFTAAGLDYNHDLLAVATGLHGGPLPASASLLSVEPSGAVLSALKPRGNPLAPSGQPRPSDGLTARLREIGGGGPVPARLRLFTGITGALVSSLCEDSIAADLPVTSGEASVEVPRAGLVTVRLDTAAGADPAAVQAPATGAGPPEPAQPVHARYWLHGKGPAPAGNMPVAVHLSPARLALDDGTAQVLQLTLACGPSPAAGKITLDIPAGIALEPPGPLAYDLPPRGYASWDLTVQPAAGTPPGRRFVTAQITDDCGQTVEDSALLAIGQPELRFDLPLFEMAALVQANWAAVAGEAEITVLARGTTPGTPAVLARGTTPGPPRRALSLRPGEAGAVEVLVANRAESPIHGAVQLISPFGSWQQANPWTSAFGIAPGDTAALRFDVVAPVTARTGEQWWAIVKVMYFGRARYSDPIEVTIG
jgi:alpha-mannosidase